MWDVISDALLGAIPKELRITIMRLAWIGVVSFHMVWACGWLAPIGLAAPFARADDMNKTSVGLSSLAEQLREDRIERLDQAIQTVRGLQCRTAIDSDARRNYTDRLNALWAKYVQIAGKEPHVPRCDET